MHCNRHLNKIIWTALAMLLLIVPSISASHLFTGWVVQDLPLTTLDIEAAVPQYSRTATFSIEGRTKPLASVHAFVNDARVRVYTPKADGRFQLLNMPLTQATNTLKLEAREGEAVASKEFTVIYDGTPPTITLTKEIPQATTENSITIAGDVNEKVTIYYRAIHKTDSAPPDIIAKLNASKIEQNAVELTWDVSPATDLKEYLILRDGTRIAATTLTSFRDENLQTNKGYTYGVSAVDSSCNIGTSADTSVTTKPNGTNATPSTPQHVGLSCEPAYQTTTAGSPFSVTLSLLQGLNVIEIIFQDNAGNQEVINQTVHMDATPPKFEQTNLAELTPAYIPDVKIKGKLDEQATVFLYIGNESKPSDFVVTDPDGSFSIKAMLRRDIRIKKGTTTAALDLGEGWVNKVRLEAVDLAGNKATYGPVDIDYLLCGTGTWWKTNIGEAMPSTLLPRLMIQGIQQIGIAFNISYIGGQNVKLGRVNVNKVLLAKGAEKDYDHDWVQVDTFTRPKGPKDLIGFVQVRFENVEPLPDKPSAGPNEKELALSDHRRGECLVPGVGCVNLFLQMEIQFQEIIQMKATDPRLPLPSPKIEPRVQRVCMPVQVAIDQTVPLDVIPKGLLRTAVKAIGKAITLIDKVLKPMTTIGEYVLYGCLASNLWLYVDVALEKWSCEASSTLSTVFKEGAWNKAVAEAGVCKEVYSGDKDGQKQAACMGCQGKLETRKKFEANVMHGLCDRVGCPAAPTFATYIKDQSGSTEPLGDLSAAVEKNDPTYFAKWAVGGAGGTQGGGQLYAGNDCAFTYKGIDHITPTYAGTTQEYRALPPPRGGQEAPMFGAGGEPIVPIAGTTDRLGIRALFDIAKGKEKSTVFPSGPTADDCKKYLHPAHPNCCGVQYQREWSSACGIGTVLGEKLDTFDELKESTCLSAQQANADASDLKCNNLWNAVAGFCEKGTGEPRAETINAEARWEPRKDSADENAAYFFVIPTGFNQSFPGGLVGGAGTAQQYQVWLGYAIKTPQIQKLTEPQKTGLKKFELSASMTAALETDVSGCFGQKPGVRAEAGKTTPARLDEQQQIACVTERVCKGISKISPCGQQDNIKRAVQQINDVIQVPDQQYIVRPYSGLLRSIQCVCLPAVTSYLQMWQKLLGAFHACFNKILLTGEGSEGFCAAKLSGTICDMFFEVISCFTQKFNAPGVGARIGTGGFSSILGVITGAGTDVSKSVGQRYGSTPLYKSLFSENKLVHAVCTWAFTGTWDLDIGGLFQQQVEDVPVDTMAAVSTCQRTWISYDITTAPPGLTTWAYHIAGGMIAGSDVRYRLKLKCSSGFTCDPREYRDGRCDCQTGERFTTVSNPDLGTGLAKKFDVVNFDAPFVINAQSQPDSDVRYDTAILEWDWTDPVTKQVRTDKAECSIRQTDGGEAPAFCALDVFSGKFRCLFGEQDAGIRMIAADPAYPQNQSAYGIGDNLSFSLEFKQRFPEERRQQQQNRKFLLYDIRDASGATVLGKLRDVETPQPLKTERESVRDDYRLMTNGVYRKNVPETGDTTPLGRFTIDKGTIERHSAAGPAITAIPQDIWGVTTPLKPVKRVSATTATGLIHTSPAFFSIHFPNFKAEAGEESFQAYRITPGADGKAPPKDPTKGWTAYRSAPLSGGKQSAQKPLNTVSIPIPGTSAADTLVVTIEFDRITGFNADQLEILVEYRPPNATVAAAPKCDPKNPVTWTAVFTVYDADRNGYASDQISVDPETGEQQQRFVNFAVQCATKDELAAMQKTVTVAVPGLQWLFEQFNALLSSEKDAIAAFKTLQPVQGGLTTQAWLTKPPQAAIALKTAAQDFQNAEKTNIGELKNRFGNLTEDEKKRFNNGDVQGPQKTIDEKATKISNGIDALVAAIDGFTTAIKQASQGATVTIPPTIQSTLTGLITDLEDFNKFKSSIIDGLAKQLAAAGVTQKPGAETKPLALLKPENNKEFTAPEVTVKPLSGTFKAQSSPIEFEWNGGSGDYLLNIWESDSKKGIILSRTIKTKEAKELYFYTQPPTAFTWRVDDIGTKTKSEERTFTIK